MPLPNTTLLCRQCDYVTTVNTVALQQRRKAGLVYPCKHCGTDLIREGGKTAHGRTDNQKRSRAQEKRAAKRIGGVVQPASGALPGAKGDVRKKGEVRMECKLTRAKSFSLKLEELMKIEQEAERGEAPALEIEFQGVHPKKRYVVIPGWLYDHYIHQTEGQ